MRSGTRLGVDVGKARIGVARCDPSGLLATPLETVPRAADPEVSGELGATVPLTDDLRRILELVDEYSAFEVVVGLPLGMSGRRTPSTEDAEAFARRLAAATASRTAGDRAAVAVRLVDERLSTVSAQGQLRQAGRKTKQTRHIIDQAAAVVILQHALDAERARGDAPGTVVWLAEPENGDTV